VVIGKHLQGKIDLVQLIDAPNLTCLGLYLDQRRQKQTGQDQNKPRNQDQLQKREAPQFTQAIRLELPVHAMPRPFSSGTLT
jgi:hypothetical protein